MMRNFRLDSKSILFISGGFYEYDNIIIKHIKKMGGDVTYICSSPTTNHTFMRLYQRSMKLRKKYCDKIYKKIVLHKYDYILILNSARLTDEFIVKLCEHYKDSIKILYCWDSVRTIPEIKNRIKYFDYVFSFDSEDARTIENVSLLPLFYSKKAEKIDKFKENITFSFVGFGHSKRYNFINKIKQYANRENYSYCFKLYLPSILYFIRGKYYNKTFEDASIKDFIYKSLDSKSVGEIMGSSSIIVDYEVGTQSGLTMRTIETLGMKKKLITTNKHIQNYDFFDERNILVVDKENPIINDEFVKGSYKELPESIYRKYSIHEWLLHMFFYGEYSNDKYYNANL